MRKGTVRLFVVVFSSLFEMATNSDCIGNVELKTVEEVCNFLRGRAVEREVLEKFRQEKMDASAVKQSSVDDLKELGLSRRGDILALKSFCSLTSQKSQEVQYTEKKRRLLAEFLNNGSFPKKSKKNSQQAFFTERPEKKKTVLAGWMHFNSSTEKYTTVRLNNGGGIRNVDFPLDAGRLDIISSLKAL